MLPTKGALLLIIKAPVVSLVVEPLITEVPVAPLLSSQGWCKPLARNLKAKPGLTGGHALSNLGRWAMDPEILRKLTSNQAKSPRR